MKPIIKWSGGKSQEIKFFEEFFPKEFNRYVEPFVGGGGVFFYLEHKPSIINDVNFDLISFYSILKNENDRKELLEELWKLNAQRLILNTYFNRYSDKELFDLYNSDFDKPIDFIFIEELELFLNPDRLSVLVEKSLLDKIKRIHRIEEKEKKKFSADELREHFTTAFQSALYFYAREIYNEGIIGVDLPYYIANWYYVREFCYSSMFRFSKNGKFNVPYGGIGYNSKNFALKIKRLQEDEELLDLLKHTGIYKMDFQELFKKYNYFEEEDFIFLDPPYDTAFSQYNSEKDFDKSEQIRLRDELKKIKAKFMLVIKETDFIYDLYHKDFKILKFDKKYMTNMRNRNDKDVQHLVVTNY